MASNSPSTEDVDVHYVVYMPFGEEASCIPITVKAGATVKALRDKICEDRAFKAHIRSQDVDLYQCEDLSKDSGNLYHKAVNWIRDHEETHRLSPSKLLKTHFPNRPAHDEEVKVDVIAVTKSFFDIRCVVYVPYGAQAATYPFRVPKDVTVWDLTRAICDDLQVNPHLDDTPLCLFKYGNPSIGTAKTRYQNILKWLQDHSESQMLDFADRLSEHFPSGPRLSDTKVIDVIAVTESVLHRLVAGMPRSEDLWTRFNKEMKQAISACAPSKAAKPSEIRSEQMKHPLYNGHPDEFRGPPIAIYHEAFAKLKDDLAKPDAIQVTAEELNLTHQLFAKSAAFYEKEHNRVDETLPLWEQLLGATISPTTLQSNVASADGSVTVDLGPGLRALLAALEWKLELGSLGDAGYQAACIFRKFLTENKYAKLRMSTCNPCLLIGIMGPYFCIMGAVFIDVIIVEPFTEWIFLGGKPEGRVMTVARILKATADALHGLRDYYQNVTLTENADDQVRLPKPTMIEGSLQPPRLQYVDRVDPKNMARALYYAEMGDHNQRVIVKFPDGYSKEAHEILADNGLAPKLHFCG